MLVVYDENKIDDEGSGESYGFYGWLRHLTSQRPGFGSTCWDVSSEQSNCLCLASRLDWPTGTNSFAEVPDSFDTKGSSIVMILNSSTSSASLHLETNPIKICLATIYTSLEFNYWLKTVKCL